MILLQLEVEWSAVPVCLLEWILNFSLSGDGDGDGDVLTADVGRMI